MDFSGFIGLILKNDNVGLSIASLLIIGVIFVNGWTDAPNAITASVSTGALKLRSGIILAAIFNFIGALVMGIINTSVLRSVEGITFMIGSDSERALPILSAALLSIILWAVIAWYFGIPTSESHALISGIFGAALASNGGLKGMELSALRLAVAGLAISLPIGFFGGFLIGKILEVVSYNTKSQNKEIIIRCFQRLGAAAMAFMHGAQDSQKFAGVFLAAICMSGSEGADFESVPIWLTLLCSMVISLGTAAGGYRIIKRVGMDTVALTPVKGLAADISAALSMLLASAFGMPVSTTHTATASVVGAGISSYPKKINTGSIREMMIAWILTFPCCGLISFCAAKLYILLF